MAQNHQTQLRSILRELEVLDDASVQDGVWSAFVEIRDTGVREVTVRANVEGLVALATYLLRLAVDPASGKHVHVDTSGIADHCDRDLVLAYSPATWNRDAG